MALTHFAFGVLARGPGGEDLDALRFESIVSQGLVPSASNQQTTATAPTTGGGRTYCQVATDTAVYVAFGADPNATTAARRIFLPANTVRLVQVSAGDEGAVVTI